MIEDMQVRNLSKCTQDSYVRQVSLFARHFKKSPELLGPEQIRAYQICLMNEKKLAPISIMVAISALRFLYGVTLKKDWSFKDIIPVPKKPQTLPVVLSPGEVIQFLACVTSRKHRAILTPNSDCGEGAEGTRQIDQKEVRLKVLLWASIATVYPVSRKTRSTP
jgi:site-specific recombinase XerD